MKQLLIKNIKNLTILITAKKWLRKSSTPFTVFFITRVGLFFLVYLFITASLILKEKLYFQTVVYFSALMLALFTIMFSHFYWVA